MWAGIPTPCNPLVGSTCPTVPWFCTCRSFLSIEEALDYPQSVCVAFRQLLWVVYICFDDISSLTMPCPELFLVSASHCLWGALVDLGSCWLLVLHIGLGPQGRILSSIPEPDGLIERRLSLGKGSFFLVFKPEVFQMGHGDTPARDTDFKSVK